MNAEAALASASMLDYLRARTGIVSWLTTTDHKRIGILYLAGIVPLFLLAASMAVMFRLELFAPGQQFIDNDAYNRLLTVHGVVMIFLFVIPGIPAAFGNFFLPIMIGARDVAFPRLNLGSWYCYVAGALLALASVIIGPADTGWTFYVPYSVKTQHNVLLPMTAAFILGWSSILTGVNFVTTVHRLRLPEMGWFQMPLFVWALYATAWVQIVATPVVGITLLLIIVERVFDGLVMLLFVFFTLPQLSVLPDFVRWMAVLGTVAFVGALVVFLALAAAPQRFAAVYTWLIARCVPSRFRAPLTGFLDRFSEGLSSLRSGRDILMIFVTSVFVWLMETVKYWFVMHAFHFQVSFFALMLMNGVVNLATTLPAAPGYVGTFDTPGIKVLEAFGVPLPVATAYTLVLHVALWFPVTALGAWYFAREGLHWSDVGKARQATSDTHYTTGNP